MFDRVASRYDLLNSVMTAGLHHRWRERAADRAELGPGDAALDVCCGTGDLALELAGTGRLPAATSSAATSPSRCSTWPVRRPRAGQRAACASSGPMRSACPTTRAASTRLRSASASATSPTSTVACGRWPVSCVPVDGSSILEITQPIRPPLSTFYSLWFDRIVPAPRLALGRVRGLRLPGRVGTQLSRPAAAGGEDGRGRPRANPLDRPRRRDRRDPQRRPRVTRRSAVPPPVTAVLDASSRWLPARLGEVEEQLREQSRGHGELLDADAGATLAAGGKRLRPLLVLLCAGPDGGEAAVRAAAAVELVHMATLVHDDVLDDAPLRRGQPTVAAASGRSRAIGRRRPALLACLRPARRARGRPRHRAARRSLGGARPGRAGPAPGRLRHDHLRAALPRALPPEDGDALRVRLPAGPRRARQLGAFGAEIGLAFQLLDDVLDVSGPPERTGKARGTDLLDGTVTLPLIVAAEAEPEIRSRRSARPRPSQRRGGSATGSPPPGRSTRSAPGPWRWSPRPSSGSRRPASTPSSGACSTSSPTASCSATA